MHNSKHMRKDAFLFHFHALYGLQNCCRTESHNARRQSNPYTFVKPEPVCRKCPYSSHHSKCRCAANVQRFVRFPICRRRHFCSFQQMIRRYAKYLAQRNDLVQIRHTLLAFPFGYSLPRYANLLSQLLLRISSLFSQFLYSLRHIHCPFLLSRPKIIFLFRLHIHQPRLTMRQPAVAPRISQQKAASIRSTQPFRIYFSSNAPSPVMMISVS